MGLIALGAVTAGGCLLCSEYEKNRLTVRRYYVQSDRLPDSFDGVRIVLLADLHGKSFGPGNEKLYNRIQSVKPDYILSAGDLILKTKPQETAAVSRFMGRLTSLCPVYCANGNHELELKQRAVACGFAYEHYTARLKKAGVMVLADSTAVLERGGDCIDVSGLDLDLAYYAKGFHAPMRAGYIEGKLGRPVADRFHILLGHYPNYFPEYAAWGADLVLSGHMHGGTVRLPFVGGLMSPNYEFFPVYDRGIYEREGSCMIVSSGLGTHSVNIRLGGNYPEIVLIILKKKK